MSHKISLRLKQLMALLALIGILFGVIGTAWLTTTNAPTAQDVTIKNP